MRDNKHISDELLAMYMDGLTTETENEEISQLLLETNGMEDYLVAAMGVSLIENEQTPDSEEDDEPNSIPLYPSGGMIAACAAMPIGGLPMETIGIAALLDKLRDVLSGDENEEEEKD